MIRKAETENGWVRGIEAADPRTQLLGGYLLQHWENLIKSGDRKGCGERI